MPGPVSDSYQGPPDDGPYVPDYCYASGPKVCRDCGCHEGFHNDEGQCLRAYECNCAGLHPEDRTPLGE